MDKTGVLPDVLIEGGAILTMEHGKNQLCFGVELSIDWNGMIAKHQSSNQIV